MNAQSTINKIRNNFKDIPGVVGVVLGGPRAVGLHRPNSDIDIRIYYDDLLGFDMDKVNEVVTKMDNEKRNNLVAPLGEWGPWDNTGGTLKIRDYQVNLVFRDIKKVSQVVDDCLSGNITPYYHRGHPHAFINLIYMGEISVCRILVDTENQIAGLNSKTFPYPEILKEKIIKHFIYESEISLDLAKANIGERDLSYVAGQCYRSVASLNQVLFALNEQYCIDEKGATGRIANFENKPEDYRIRVDEIFDLLSIDRSSTEKALNILEELVGETKAF